MVRRERGREGDDVDNDDEEEDNNEEDEAADDNDEDEEEADKEEDEEADEDEKAAARLRSFRHSFSSSCQTAMNDGWSTGKASQRTPDSKRC